MYKCKPKVGVPDQELQVARDKQSRLLTRYPGGSVPCRQAPIATHNSLVFRRHTRRVVRLERVCFEERIPPCLSHKLKGGRVIDRVIRLLYEVGMVKVLLLQRLRLFLHVALVFCGSDIRFSCCVVSHACILWNNPLIWIVCVQGRLEE